jgi:hypothetical protein
MRKGIDCKGKEWEERKLSTLMSDLCNQKFGMLTPLFPVITNIKRSGVSWLCQCDCGNQIIRSASSLKEHKTESCGCLSSQRRSNANDKHRMNMIGMKFNKLTVVDVAEIRLGADGSKRTYYKCMCDCGNPKPVVVRGTDLRLGKQLSCGCAKSEAEARDRENLIGRSFGKLTVVDCAYIKNHIVYWHCLCECGNELDVRGGDLKNGHTSSCGCILSVGELNIINILKGSNVKYIHNKGYFQDLVSNTGLPLRYDFIIFDNNDTLIRLVEFDGPQHNRPSDLFGLEEFQKLQFYDSLKNQYALSHNIPLVRIPYSKRDTMTYDDIFGDKYLIKGDNYYG